MGGLGESGRWSGRRKMTARTFPHVTRVLLASTVNDDAVCDRRRLFDGLVQIVSFDPATSKHSKSDTKPFKIPDNEPSLLDPMSSSNTSSHSPFRVPTVDVDSSRPPPLKRRRTISHPTSSKSAAAGTTSTSDENTDNNSSRGNSVVGDPQLPRSLPYSVVAEVDILCELKRRKFPCDDDEKVASAEDGSDRMLTFCSAWNVRC